MPDETHIPAAIAAGILLVFLLFFSGCNTEPVETDIVLPVDFSNVPQGMVLTRFHTDRIKVLVKGDPKRIEALQHKAIRYPADLYTDLEFDPAGASDSIEPGHYLLPVDKTRIPVTPGIRITGISPFYLSVQLDRQITRTFKVNAPYSGTPSQGYMALEPAISPSSVDLTGAQQVLDQLPETLPTKPVDLGNATEAFKKEVPLALDKPGLFTDSQQRPMFIVTVPILPKTVTKTLTDLPIHLIHSPGHAHIEPGLISIDIKGPQEVLDSKTVLGKITAFIDLKGLKPGVYARHAYIDIPVGLSMTNAAPQVFTITIK